MSRGLNVHSGIGIQITEEHLQSLIENQVPEGRDLEVQARTVGRDDASQKEFLKDMSALANAAGGDLVIGMAEADDVAASLHGNTASPADDGVRMVEAILQDGLEPRLIGARLHAVQLSAGAIWRASNGPVGGQQ
jgi:predicted HTH transcriptional regulator